MNLLETFEQVLNIIQSQLVNIPINNGLSVVYVVLQNFLLLFVTIVSGLGDTLDDIFRSF